MFAVSLLSRFMHLPSELHFKAIKRALRYVKGTSSYGVAFFSTKESNDEAILMGYYNSDWASSSEDMKSIFGYLFSFGSGAFTWSSRKQELVAQSTTE